MSITITLSHDAQTLVSLRDEWIELQSRSSAQSIELSWQWIDIWYKHHGESCELWIMTARKDDRLIGIAPLTKVKGQSNQGIAWQQIEFISASHEREHLNFIIETGYEQQVIPQFIDKLYEHKSQWDVISLSAISDTTTVDILQHSNRDWIEDRQKNMAEPHMRLPDTVDEWMQSISTNHRQKLRRYRRKLDEQFPDRWSVRQVTESDKLDETFEHLVNLHQTYWEARGETGNFQYGELKAYFHDLMHCMQENGWLRFYRLDIDDEPCALSLCFHYYGRAYYGIVATKRDIVDFPIGYILLEHIINRAINEGCHEFTFMHGQISYKYSFGGVDREHYAFLLIGNPRLRLQIKSINLLRKVKSRIHIRSRINGVKSRIREVASVVSPRKANED